jgi:peptidoglycan/xylan/chitin deacetylase (PgdA/CDA1 family)
MSNHPLRYEITRLLAVFAVLIAGVLMPTVSPAEEAVSTAEHSPLMVRVRQGDTPATIAQRYLNDASKAWMVREYNHGVSFSEDGAIIVPRAPFRLGGLTPAGYQTVPVLLYEAFQAPAQGKVRQPISGFKEQMQWLKTHGFTTIHPTQLIGFLAFSEQLPRQAVLITMDTESRVFLEQAIPILESLGFTATVFVASERVGTTGAISWDQLSQLQQAGFTIGCRGKYGRALTRRKKGQSFKTNFVWIESELRQAKTTIETQLGRPCQLLAYPQGKTNNLLAAMAAKLGFSAAFDRSTGDTPFFAARFNIHRTVIDSQSPPDRFGSRLTTFVKADLN